MAKPQTTPSASLSNINPTATMVSVCTTCKGLQNKLRGLDGGLRDQHSDSLEWLNTTLPALRRSTNGGCRACFLLLQGTLLHHDRFAAVSENNVRIRAESFISSAAGQKDTQNHLSVEVRWQDAHEDSCGDEDHDHEHEEPYPDLKLEFFSDTDKQTPFSAIGRGRHISDNPLKDAGLQTAQNFIKECLSTHSRCQHTKHVNLPKRLLDVQLEDGSLGIKLHETSRGLGGEPGKYLALSHCWGSSRHVLKTTKSTLQTHTKNIPWSSLPRTFQDAVALTRALGFRWLWVDSLCIVQDDNDERAQECLQMDGIFSNAFLTIAATSAAESNESLFLPKAQPFKIQATDSKGSLYRICVREQPSHYSFKAAFEQGANLSEWEPPFNSSPEVNVQAPLLKRAWAYPERLLSPRVLHFTKSEMIFECREGFQCECGRIDHATYDSRSTDSVKQELGKLISASNNGNLSNGNSNHVDTVASQLASASLSDLDTLTRHREEAIQLWSYIITEYTSRDITYDIDRLVAITGVASAFSNIFKSGYVAGQWTYNTLGLLWYPQDSAQCRRSTAPANKVPSWSWASLEGSPIFFDNTTAMDLACTVSFPSQKARSFPWSPTSGHTLELTAGMATEIQFREDGPNEYSLVKNGISAEFRPDVAPPRGTDALCSGDELICVLVSMTFRSSIIGLVLKPSNSDPGAYRRAGRFECYECQRDDSDEEPEDAEALFGHWFPEVEDMTQLDDGPQRTFTLV